MNDKLKQLADYALADGQITDKKLHVLYKKCDELGVDHDVLNKYLSNHNKAQDKSIPLEESTISAELENAIQKLDAITVEIKTAPKVSQFSIQFRIAAIVMTFGIFHIISYPSDQP
ncbi:MAG TPA: hypothetical protein DCG75_11535, partial [Bacteroidales bacterium]|nr:hypothetical protein [Bacteroidales bacterium]